MFIDLPIYSFACLFTSLFRKCIIGLHFQGHKPLLHTETSAHQNEHCDWLILGPRSNSNVSRPEYFCVVVARAPNTLMARRLKTLTQEHFLEEMSPSIFTMTNNFVFPIEVIKPYFIFSCTSKHW